MTTCTRTPLAPYTVHSSDSPGMQAPRYEVMPTLLDNTITERLELTIRDDQGVAVGTMILSMQEIAGMILMLYRAGKLMKHDDLNERLRAMA